MDLNSDLISSQSNFNYNSQNFKNRKYRTAKLFSSHHQLSSASSMTDLRQGINLKLRTTKFIFPSLKKRINPNKLDTKNLKNDLITNRTEFHKKASELHFLKIKYNKLLMDNVYNKKLLARILDIPLNRIISREMVFIKINNCKLNDEDRVILQRAYEVLKLKSDIERKKELLEQKSIYINNLEINSKRKIVSSLENEYFIKCQQQRNLLNALERLEKKYNKYEKKMDSENEKLKFESITNERLVDKEVEGMEQIQKFVDEKCSIMKQINYLAEKIKKMDKTNSDMEKEIKEKEKENNQNENKIVVIKDYKSYISEDQKEIQKMKQLKEESENLEKDTEKEMKSLQDQYESLSTKMHKYRDEKPKLLRKANESKKEIERLESLKKELEETKKNKETTEQSHMQKQNELKEIKNKNNTDNEEYIKIIEANNQEKDELNKKIEELSQKLDEVTNNNNDIFFKVNNGQTEINKLEQNIEDLKKQIEQNELEDQENKQKNDEEKNKEINKIMKERKREIDKLTKEHNRFSDDNKRLTQEIKLIQEELDGFNIDLENFDSIQSSLNEAIAKLNNLKK